MINGKPKAIIRDWFFANPQGDEKVVLQGEEIGSKKVLLYGRTYENEDYDPYTGEFSDGHRIITSPVVEVDWGTFLVKTMSGSIYMIDGPEGNLDDFYGVKDEQTN